MGNVFLGMYVNVACFIFDIWTGSPVLDWKLKERRETLYGKYKLFTIFKLKLFLLK